MMSSVAGASDAAAAGNKNNKTRWPEVVGMLAEDAAKVIKRDMPSATIEVLSSDEPASMDLVPDRVRLFVDTVAMAPTVSTQLLLRSSPPFFDHVGERIIMELVMN